MKVMPVTRTSSEFGDNFIKIMEFCQNYKEPLFLTNNDNNQAVVMNINTYEEIMGRQKLYNLLAEGRKAFKEGRFYTEEEMDKIIDSM